ncbi:MAG: hypothetical protein COA84_14965 [Robiginitomaculum sp.]|nr:MAG: hypothetical protein COA84_14965 [Robiginitomaculum sp.]
MGEDWRNIFVGFGWGVMITCAFFAYTDYSAESNATEYKEKSLLELQIEYKKLEIESLKRGDND